MFKSLNDVYNTIVEKNIRIIETEGYATCDSKGFYFEFPPTSKRVCDLFNHNEEIIYAPRLP
jgi:hypothetical protein